MNEFALSFHHFGLAVAAPDAAFRYLAGLGYRPGAECFDPLQQVNLAMRHHDSMPDVEVIWPGAAPSPIDRLIKRNGSMIYHLCYTSDDVAASVAALEAAGHEVLPLGASQPALLFDGLEVSFYGITDVGIIEIIAGTPKPRTDAAAASR